MKREKTKRYKTEQSVYSEALYVCTTPFQIMTSISMIKESGECADLLVDPQFAGAESILDRIRKEEIFNRVLNAEESMLARMRKRKGLMKDISFAYRLFRGKRLYYDMLKGDCRYKKLYASSNNAITRYIMNYVLKQKLGTQFVLFDDGEGSYDGDAVAGFYRRKRNLLHRLIVKEIKDEPYKRYLYIPELFYKTYPGYQGEVVKLPNWSEQEEMSLAFNRIFQADREPPVSERFVLLDSVFTETGEVYENRYKEVIEKIIRIVGDKNICVKKHPRDKSEHKYGIRAIESHEIPFECLVQKIESEDKVIISLYSSAAFWPKILFGKEFYIIFLFRLFNSSMRSNHRRDLYYGYLEHSYKDQDRILIPKDVRELELYLNRLCRDTSKNVL